MNKLLFKGHNIRIPIIIPIKGRGCINQGFTLLGRHHNGPKGVTYSKISRGIGFTAKSIGQEVCQLGC